MKSLMSLWSRLAEESASLCCTSATEDINTVLRRSEHEGLSFMTITLPDYGKAIRKWLDRGQVDINQSFRNGRKGGLPLFLGGFLSRVFDRNSGALLDDPCIDSILALQQLTLLFGKIELDCSKKRQAQAIQRFLECEQEVRQFDATILDSDIEDFSNMSNLLFGDLFSQMELKLQMGQILPKHGPGATAEKLTSNGRYKQQSWTSRLQRVFKFSEFTTANFLSMMYSYTHEWSDGVTFLEPGEEVPVRVHLVPKTMKTPRVIAIEPACMQYMQQAVLGVFLECFKRDNLLKKLIGFDDQVPNQVLARSGSLGRGLATLDLSDASDRVSNQLVRTMFSRWPILLEAVDATRSRRADVPGVGVKRLAKYASMGSALCFPIEAMVFTTIIFLGIQKSLNAPLTKKEIRKSFSRSVRVYGDDLIVPVEHVTTVVQTLEHFGARVGLDKSFWTGKFRESCGREYYAGEDISIVRVRNLLPTQRHDAGEVASMVSLRNQLYQAGYWKTCGWLDDQLRRILRFYPNVTSNSSLLGKECSLGVTTEEVLGFSAQRTCPNYQIPLVKGFYLVAKPPSDHLEGAGALLKCLLKLEHGTLEPKGPYPKLTPLDIAQANSSEHLERCGRPKRVSMKLGWRPPL